MAFERIFDASNATPFKFEGKGAVLEGYFMGSFDYQGDYGPTKKHVFQTKRGAEVVFGQRNLMQQLPSVKAGTMVRITYTGDLNSTKKGRQPMKLFTIEHDRGNTIEVVGVELTPTENTSEESYEEPASNYEAVEETGLDDDDNEVEAAAPVARSAPPKRPVQAPSAASQAKVQELLNRSRNKTA